jgi:hypothetical protein
MKLTDTANSMLRAIGSANVKSGYIKLAGGLDEMTPPYERSPGSARKAQNFECDINGGYATVTGYERYDGRPKPSESTYIIVNATITGAAAVGDTLTGVPSGATGVIIALPGGSFVMTKRVGTFVSGEELQISAVTVATATSGHRKASTALMNAQYMNLAADSYRADIGVPTGSGVILGGFYFDDVNYCFRNNAGGTAAGLWKESASGWTAVALGRELSFTSGGTYEISEGDTITGAISAATAVITRVVLESGTFAAGTAAGRLIFASQTGTFQAENLNVGASLNVATIDGNSSAITLLPSGRYAHVKENFGGYANSTRVYGCDGVNRGFEFDGTVFVPISTGMATDTPVNVFAHKKHLFYSFAGSVQHSGIGNPYIWTPLLGATELAMGDTVTGFAAQPGTSAGAALAIFTRNRLSILYGSSSADWQLVPYRDELGAFQHTIQDVGYTMFLDDRGITDIQTSQNYGNFAHNALTDRIKTLMASYKPFAVASSICRDKSQYRLFFSSGRAFYITVVGRKMIGIMPMKFPDVVRCAWTSETNSGEEVMFFGSDDGYVYQMDKGTSFDGDAIEFFIDLAYNFFGSPRVDKSFFDATIENQGTGYAAFNFGYSLDYRSTDTPQPANQAVVTNFSAARWDSFVWDAFQWDGRVLFPSNLDMDGMAENVSLAIRGSSDYYSPLKFTAALVHYAPRRRLNP